MTGGYQREKKSTESQNLLPKGEQHQPQINTHNLPPRVGFFICHCSSDAGSVVPLTEFVLDLPFVVCREDCLNACSSDCQQKIIAKIKEHNINRVILVSCSPKISEPILKGVAEQTGLDPVLTETVNLKEQFGNQFEQNFSQEKAKDAVKMAWARSLLAEPLEEPCQKNIQKALVIGGGLAGMTVALSIAKQNFPVFLVEKSDRLGGRLNDVYYLPSGRKCAELLQTLTAQVESHPQIKVYLNSEITSNYGHLGNFTTEITRAETKETLQHGIVVVATGAKDYVPAEYLYNQDERILTQRQLEKGIYSHEEKIKRAKTVVMIQCVGSFSQQNPECSQICCVDALKNTRLLKELNKKVNVYLLYQYMHPFVQPFYGEKESRSAITFVRYKKECPVVFRENGQLAVKVKDITLGEEVLVYPDLVVLSCGVTAYWENKKLAELLKVNLDKRGFFSVNEMQLGDISFDCNGVFVCGLAEGPKLMEETILQAGVAAGKAVLVLRKEYLVGDGTTAVVNSSRCTGCAKCVQACPYNAIEIDHLKKTAVVKSIVCKGCGICCATCFCGAIDLRGFSDEKILTEVTLL